VNSVSPPATTTAPKSPETPSGIRGKGYRIRLIQLYFTLYLKWITWLDRIAGAWGLLLAISTLYLMDLRGRRRDYSKFLLLRGRRPDAFWKGVTPAHHYFTYVWHWLMCGAGIVIYPRLGSPYWRKRFRVVGTPPQELPEWNKRPVVLACIHIGGFSLIPFWLRSMGIRAATIIGGLPPIIDNDEFRRICQIGDRAYGLEGLPLMFPRRGPSVRETFRFLKPGNILVMAIDGGKVSAEHDSYDAGGFTFYANQGAARFAASTKAILVPVTLVYAGFFRYEARFGTPVPDELLQNEDYHGATQNLVTQLWQAALDYPAEISWTAMEAYAPEMRGFRHVIWP
jgi:hypothetical protein